jgi:Ca2+-binding EF-hand superfamily protein
VFHYFDDDNTGFIDFRKLKTVAGECCSNIDDSTIRRMIEAADTDGDGKVSKYEFMRVMKKMKLI